MRLTSRAWSRANDLALDGRFRHTPQCAVKKRPVYDPGFARQARGPYHRMEGFFVHRFAIESPQDFLLSKDKRYSGESEVPVTLPADVFQRSG